jgi:membrane protease YdiL (CAAX protease family)
MSILPILGQTEQPVETLAFILGAVGVAGAVVVAAGVLRPRSVMGPARLGEDESPVVLWFMLLLGITVWQLIPQIYIQAKVPSSQTSATTKSTTQQVLLNPHEQVELTTISGLFGLVVLVAGNVVVRKQGLSKLGLNRRSLNSALLPIAVSVAAVIPIMYLSQYFTQVLWDRVGMEHPDAHPLLEIFKDQVDPGLRALVVASAVLLAPTFEEILFRGHMQTAILHSISPREDTVAARWIAILITSVLFAAVHGEIWMMPPIFILSVCLGYAYERTGNLWVSIGIHAAFNTANIAYFILSKLAH